MPDLIEAHIVHAFGTTPPNSLASADSSFHSRGLLTTLISECDLIAQFGGTDQLAIARMCVPSPADGDQANHIDLNHPHPMRTHSSAKTDLTPALLFLYYALFVYDYQLALRISTNRRKFNQFCMVSFSTCHMPWSFIGILANRYDGPDR